MQNRRLQEEGSETYFPIKCRAERGSFKTAVPVDRTTWSGKSRAGLGICAGC